MLRIWLIISKYLWKIDKIFISNLLFLGVFFLIWNFCLKTWNFAFEKYRYTRCLQFFVIFIFFHICWAHGSAKYSTYQFRWIGRLRQQTTECGCEWERRAAVRQFHPRQESSACVQHVTKAIGTLKLLEKLRRPEPSKRPPLGTQNCNLRSFDSTALRVLLRIAPLLIYVDS